jgi:hypothetical protein
MTRVSRWAHSILVFATAAAITAVSGAASPAQQELNEGRLRRFGNGPGPGPNGPGPGCNVIPSVASIGTKVDISEFPPPLDSLTDPRGQAGLSRRRRLQPLVLADNGVIYDAPIVAAAVDEAQINFPNGKPNYALVHDQVIAIDPYNRTVTLNTLRDQTGRRSEAQAP